MEPYSSSMIWTPIAGDWEGIGLGLGLGVGVGDRLGVGDAEGIRLGLASGDDGKGSVDVLPQNGVHAPNSTSAAVVATQGAIAACKLEREHGHGCNRCGLAICPPAMRLLWTRKAG
jgi:hypothetical protein